MAQSTANRKKKPIHYRPERHNSRNRAIRRSVERKKKKSGENELKEMLKVIVGFILALVIIITLYKITGKLEK